MRRFLAAAAVVAVAALAALVAWTLRDDGAGGDAGSGGSAAPVARTGTAAAVAAARPGEAEARPKPRARARRPGEFVASGDELWDRARREALAGRPLEALEVVLSARRKGAPPWKDAARVAEILTWEDAALDAFEASMRAMERDALFDWLRRLDGAVLDPARRKRLDQLRRVLVEAGELDLATVLDAASAESRRDIEAHLRRFGGLPAPDGAAPDPDGLDVALRSLRARNEQRPAPVPALPVDDAEAREQRRLEQLEKLRQRQATGLLSPIAAGLAWTAIHQADDGEVSDDAVAARCTWLGHTLCTAQGGAPKGQHRLAATALAVLAWLDFRDQDLAALFEPSLSLGVTWLRKQMKQDGSLPQSGYEAAIAMMALGQAARATRSVDIRRDVERGLVFVASKASADGGYRYRWGDPGDLSVAGWFVQAFEQARDAGCTVPLTLHSGLDRFVRSVWIGGEKFKYVADRPREQTSLSGVGMLSLQILAPADAEKQHDAWRAALAGSAARTRNDLYAAYYEVRTELALQGTLSPERQALLAQLPLTMQRRDAAAAGMFGTSPIAPPAAPAGSGPKERKPPPPRWTSLGIVDRGGRAVATSFAVLTMEHALYRR